MEDFITIEKARFLAERLLSEAKENEPLISADLQSIASGVSAEMVGLENKFKSEESLARKLFNTAVFNSEPLEQVAESVNDTLRYTFVLPFETYAQEFRRTIMKLQDLDYQIPKERIWNAWQTIGKRFDRGYRGINITVISSQIQSFELQFHTAESYKLKTETHFLYKELRDKKFSVERQSEVIETLKKAAENIRRPKGV